MKLQFGYLIIYLLLSITIPFHAQNITFNSDHIVYKGKTITLSKKAFFIDGSLSNAEANKHEFVFNSITEASKHLTQGTENAPMKLYIAPWVYWLDNPDDPEIRTPKPNQSAPIGLEISCDWLSFIGLSNKPEHIILASNRGQTMGAKGNFTMLSIKGDGTYAENITFGNYCNIDLEYPLHPELNRKKRGSAIVQAQLVFSNGDKVHVKNSRFISRLNLGPFWGSKRTLFENCHFEMTDDALNGNAVYLNSTFQFYSSKPFYLTNNTGAVFLNCDIQVFTRGNQYFTKAGGPIAIVNTRFTSDKNVYLGWRDKPALETKNYQYQVSLNNSPVTISKNDAYATVDMTNKSILNAYIFKYNNQTVYNTYNLLRGNDDWDPSNIKPIVLAAEKASDANLSTVPTQLIIQPTQQILETGKNSIKLTATTKRFGNFDTQTPETIWSVSEAHQPYVILKPQPDGSCLIIPTNTENDAKKVIISTTTQLGLQATSVLTINPSFLNPPTFSKQPKIIKNKNGSLHLDYSLDMEFEDQSLISWYRCTDKNGSNPIEISVSRLNKPLKTYKLYHGYIGYFIMAKISPKHKRCHAGEPKTVVFSKKISSKDIKSNHNFLEPDFETLSVKNQPQVIPGFWTLDSYAPEDTKAYNWEANNDVNPWYFGEGINGAAGVKGFVQNIKGARMRYQPVGNAFEDMTLSFMAFPAKTAGQGFSSARAQYMDIGIKMDIKNMNGYALRLIRTTKYSDAIDFILMQYTNGVATAISEPVSASCYRAHCKITIKTRGNQLIVHAENASEYDTKHTNNADVVKVVDLQAQITPNSFGGFSFQHTGTVGSGATLIKDLKVEWF